MQAYFKDNKLLQMPNLRRPVNNAHSHNYLNACNCVFDHDTISTRAATSLSHSIHALQLHYIDYS